MPTFFLISAFLAEVLGTLAGFGSSTLLLPVAVLVFDYRQALVIVAVFHLFGNFVRLGLFHTGLDRRLLVRFGLPSLIFSILGALLVAHISPALLTRLLGIILILYSSLSLYRDSWHLPASATATFIGGSLSGFLAGLVGTGGAIRGAFLSPLRLSKDRYLATAAAIAIIVDLARTGVYLRQGFFATGFYSQIPLLLILSFVGTLVGRLLVNRLSLAHFRRFIFLGLLLSGIKFVL
ncbi:hypothetical protein A2899_04995 [Candidatus Amesbacteria bacterium RIFCSPLOWO2_01_FULL_49_25]|nr:MAG: hypothetical protein A2899_04995 [Candidatus Amesbacteria bacterium RIFCSPLOWO2_01_FULL_49_25]